MLSSFRESQSFLWYTTETEELGRGTYGIVFRGMHKDTGEPVAVKLPHSNVVVSEETEQREIEVFQRINHPNIVKLLGYEEESQRQRRDRRPVKVIIMELCDGGSLLKILEHPSNCFGLEDDEFLTVLRDLTAGMKYLRENGIIHRDLKPANIMRCVADDGTSIYKITDFGAARELDDNQEYSTIVGTEEYLHPDVYEQALLPDATVPKKKFSPSTDLWSIGATLYHVATGMLPFRPDGMRKNRKVMHLMTTKKESGVIAAYQIKDTGKVVFEKHLPKNCLLSPDLKRLLCPLLAGLMEVDPRKKLSFESYFTEAENILSRRQLHIFYIGRLHLLRLYINSSEIKSFPDLQALIHAHTKIEPENQILLYKDSPLERYLEADTTQVVNLAQRLPETSKTNPIILCNRSDPEIGWKPPTNLTLKKKLFPNTVDYQRDADIGRHNCSVAHHAKRQIDDACLKVNLIHSAVQTINQVVVAHLTTASKENMLIHKAVHSMKNQFEMMKGFHALCIRFAKLVPEDISNEEPDCTTNFHESIKRLEGIYNVQYSEFQKLEKMLSELKPPIQALLGSRVQNRFLMNTWEQAAGQAKGVNDFLRMERIAVTLVSNIGQSYGEIRGDLPSVGYRRRAPEPEEQCLHLIERAKLLQMMDKLEKNQSECINSYHAVNKVLSEWYKQAIAAAIQPEILVNNLARLQETTTHLEKSLSDAVSTFKVQLEKVTLSLSAFPVVSGNIENSQNRKESIKTMKERLQELSRVQGEIQSNFKVNIELCDQLQNLLSNSFSETSP